MTMNNPAPRKKNTVDRRVARTRAGLQHALIALIVRKGYDAITVEDICEEANVGRSTFYLHYASKDALKRSGLEHLRNELIEHRKSALAETAGTNGFLGFSLALFEHASSHIELHRALVGSRGGGVTHDQIREILADLVRTDLAAAKEDDARAIPSELVVQFTVGACMAVLSWWLDRGAKPSPREVDAMFRHLATNGIARGRA